MTFFLTSPAFGEMGDIPPQYTCEGPGVSPPLSWTDPPPGTKSLVLIVEDPDAPDPAAPQRIWTHWLVYNLPPHALDLPENASPSGLPSGAREGVNDWNRPGYGGPCPPIGRHRYVHKLYALDTTLDLHHPHKVDLERAMIGHVLGEAHLIGTYQKGAR